MIKLIESPHNESFKYWRSLTKSKGLREGKHFLLSGNKLVREILADDQWCQRVDSILTPKGSDAFLPLPEHLKVQTIALAPNLFKEIDVLGTNFPILVLEQPQPEIWYPHAKFQGLELLCPFGDPQNLGAVARTAYAFGVQKLILLKEAAHPFLPKTIKASSGAILRIPIFSGPSINDITHPAIALDLIGTPIDQKKWPPDLRLLLGEEGTGVPATFQGDRMTLPMKGPIESLNATVASSIAVYLLTQQGL